MFYFYQQTVSVARLSLVIVNLLLLYLIVTVNVFGLAMTVAGSTACDSGNGCKPYLSQTGCEIGKYLDLTFALEVANERKYRDNVTLKNNAYVSYPFCAKVDELQSFSLKSTGKMAATTANNQFTSSPNVSLLVYGTEGFPDTAALPEKPNPDSFGSVLLYSGDVPECASGGEKGHAIVTFLILNLTMTDGFFYYIPDKSKYPLQVGFVPTCTENSCLIGGGDEKFVCIGYNSGTKIKNCAKCVKDVAEASSINTNVWVSYYGTDSKKHRFTSGSNNPINFRKFAADGILGKIRSEISNL